MDEPNRNGRRRRWRLLVVVSPVFALAIVLALLAGGIAPRRLRPTAVFFSVAAVASLAQVGTARLSTRRAQRLRASEVPWGVRLSAPLWLSTPEVAIPFEIGGVLGAIVALAGAPGIGSGVLLTFIVIGLAMPFFELGMSPRTLTFEKDGLRVHALRASFLIPWSAITAVESVGPDHMQFTTLRVADADAVVATATPDTPRARSRVAALLHDGSFGGRLLLMHWAGGLDGRTLARALEAGRRGRGEQVN